MSCGVGLRCCLDLALLWLWLWPTAVALIRSLAGELPYAAGVAQKKKKKKKKKLTITLTLLMEHSTLSHEATIQLYISFQKSC